MTKIVLSLDGGGVRGAFQAYILDHLRPMLGKVDLIIGVSAGALNGILLSQNTCQNLDVFSPVNNRTILSDTLLEKIAGFLELRPKYGDKGRREVINKYLTATKFGELKTPTIVLAYNLGRKYPQIFKSWVDTEEYIADLSMATTAAPVYFPPYIYNNKCYIDGGIAMNNPSMLGYAIATEMFPGETIKVLSIGNGDCPEVDIDCCIRKWGGIKWISNGLFSVFTDAPCQYSDEICEILLKDNYLRLIDETIGSIAIDDTTDESYQRLTSAASQILIKKADQIKAFLG